MTQLKAQDLRIGNWVQDAMHFKGYFQVEGIQETLIKSPEWWLKYDEIAPIKLTEEWLVKMGGIKPRLTTCIYFPASNIRAEIHFVEFRGGLVCEIHCSTGVVIPNDIKYVHSLQNLFYCLTGEELTIK